MVARCGWSECVSSLRESAFDAVLWHLLYIHVGCAVRRPFQCSCRSTSRGNPTNFKGTLPKSVHDSHREQMAKSYETVRARETASPGSEAPSYHAGQASASQARAFGSIHDLHNCRLPAECGTVQ